MMKKFFCAMALALCVVSASAQDEKKSSLLIYGGPQYSTANSGAALSTKISYLAGFQYERDGIFGEDLGLFGGVEYSAKGVKDMKFVDGRQASFDMNYLQVNLGVKYAKEIWGIEGFGFAGPYVAYGLGGDAEFDGHDMEDGSFAAEGSHWKAYRLGKHGDYEIKKPLRALMRIIEDEVDEIEEQQEEDSRYKDDEEIEEKK